jgi:hypothetical protein
MIGEVPDGQRGDDASEVAAGVHEPADGHGVAAADRHPGSPVGTLGELDRAEAQRERGECGVGVRRVDGDEQQQCRRGQRRQGDEAVAPQIAETLDEHPGQRAADAGAERGPERRRGGEPAALQGGEVTLLDQIEKHPV